MVILRSLNKITDFFMILAWASPFNKRSDYQLAPNYELLISANARFMHSV